MFLMKARDIWETIRQTYSKVRGAAHIYEIKTKIGATKVLFLLLNTIISWKAYG